MKTFRVYAKAGKYEIIEETNKRLPLGSFETREQAENSIARLPKLNQPDTPEMAHAMLIAGVPSEASLKSLPAKLAAMKRAEEIENGSEEM